MRFALAGVILFLVAVAITTFQYGSDVRESTATSPTVKIENTVVAVEIADTPALRERGLSGRSHLAEGTGMLFIFPESTRPGFWMKDMRFPIDILWISGAGRVVHIDNEIPPESYPRVFLPPEDVRYVLEVPSGFAREKGVSVGEEVVFSLK